MIAIRDDVELGRIQNECIPNADDISIEFSEGRVVIEGIGRIRRTETFANLISQKILSKEGAEHDNYMRHFRLYPSCDPRSGGPPYFTICILIACIFMHISVHQNCAVEAEKCWSETSLYLSKDENENRDEVWRYLSYGLLHLDSMHLISNMLVFVPAGIILELVHGTRKLLLCTCSV